MEGWRPATLPPGWHVVILVDIKFSTRSSATSRSSSAHVSSVDRSASLRLLIAAVVVVVVVVTTAVLPRR